MNSCDWKRDFNVLSFRLFRSIYDPYIAILFWHIKLFVTLWMTTLSVLTLSFMPWTVNNDVSVTQHLTSRTLHPAIIAPALPHRKRVRRWRDAVLRWPASVRPITSPRRGGSRCAHPHGDTLSRYLNNYVKSIWWDTNFISN